MKVIATLTLCCLIAVTFGRQVTLDDFLQKISPPDDPPDMYSRATDHNGDEIDGHVIVDGDILVTKEQAAIYYRDGWDGLVKSEAWAGTTRWDKNIPYVLTGLSGGVLTNTQGSISEINSKTCVNLRAKTSSDSTYLNIRSGTGCYTWLGKPSSGARSIYLSHGCGGTSSRARTPAHEIMHTMGRYHEQTRPDRDEYVTISPTNTCPSQMRKQSSASTYGICYDYDSCMHYSQWQCATSRPGGPSMTYPAGVDPNRVGQRAKLSIKDIQHIKKVHCPSMMTRLVGGDGPYEGRVEINNDNVWGTVCSDGFDTTDAEVTCKYLGHPGLEKVYATGNNVKFSTKEGSIWMSNLMCTGEEESPFDCVQAPIGNHDCSHDQDVAIRCAKAARLVGGNSGRLEVYHKGEWGSVCSHKFGRHEAKVACRMMGYSRAVRAFTGVNEDANKIVLEQLKCDGTENHLSSCDYDDTEGCSQGSAVYLQCQ